MIVIPMAGLSARFARAGYQLPKYQLPLWGRTVFDAAVGSFAAYFATEPFLLIVRDVADTAAFVRARAEALGIADATIHVLAGPTAGQAETVALGIETLAPDTRLTIFNIDTFRPGFVHPPRPPGSAGYLEVFRGAGANWSYVRPAPEGGGRVAETAEKRAISDLCCTGLYEFTSAALFRTAYAQTPLAAGERYIAPMYNALITAGEPVYYHEIPSSAAIFCGVPAEYEALRAQPAPPGF
jgi:hypothetical protein